MRSYFLFFLLAASLFALPSRAAWDKQHETFGNGNMLAAVAAGTGENAVAAGVEAQMGAFTPSISSIPRTAGWRETNTRRSLKKTRIPEKRWWWATTTFPRGS